MSGILAIVWRHGTRKEVNPAKRRSGHATGRSNNLAPLSKTFLSDRLESSSNTGNRCPSVSAPAVSAEPHPEQATRCHPDGRFGYNRSRQSWIRNLPPQPRPQIGGTARAFSSSIQGVCTSLSWNAECGFHAKASIKRFLLGCVVKKLGNVLLILLWVAACTGLFSSQSIFDAARKGDIAALKAILQANPGMTGARGEVGRSPLHEAILAAQNEAARFLIEAGSDVNSRDAEGIGPLGYAALTGNAAVAEMLIERGAKVDAQDSAVGGTPLHLAALRGNANVLRLLIDKGATIDARARDGRTPLALAAERGRRNCAEILLARGANPGAVDEMGRTPLHRAVLATDLETVRLLLARKADPMVRSTYGNTALDLAVQEGLTEIAGLLSGSGNLPVLKNPSLTGPYLGQPLPGLSPRMFAKGIVSTERDELNAVFTPDGNEFYFTIRDASGRWTIMMTALANGTWSRPRPAPFSGRWSDVDPFITADGHRLYFCSNRPLNSQSNSPKDFDIWMSERTADGWSAPVNPGEPVNSPADEFYPSLTRDRTMYFQSRRTGGPGGPDIWRVRSTAGGYAKAECLPPPVNSAGFEGDALIAPDGSWLIVSTSRDPQRGQADLFLSYAGPNGTWSPLLRLESGVSSPERGENCQMLSPDGRYLFFTRNGDIYWIDASVIRKANKR